MASLARRADIAVLKIGERGSYVSTRENIVKIARDFLDNSSFLGYNNQLMGGNVDCLQVEMRRVES